MLEGLLYPDSSLLLSEVIPPFTRLTFFRILNTKVINMCKYLIAFSIACVITIPATAAKSKELISPFGIGLHSIQGDVKEHQIAIEQCKDAGIKLVRDEVLWQNVEKEKGVLKIEDKVMQNIENTLKAGLEILLILDYGNPLYDNGNAPVSKEAVEAFARYCEFMTRSLKGKVKYWEVWNEPNIFFWKPAPNAKDYTNLLKAAYKACKKGNPDCKVIGACTSGIDLTFIEAILKEGGAKFMDAISVHPYCYPDTPEHANLAANLLQLRELIDKYGMKGKPIWITEIGWPTHQGTNGVTPEVQAAMLPRSYIEALSSGVETIFWYWLGNDGPDPAYNEHHFGLRFADGSPKPAFLAYKTMTSVLAEAKFVNPFWMSEGTKAYLFRKNDSDILAMWSLDGNKTISFVTSNPIEITSSLNNEKTKLALKPVNNLVSLTLTEIPCYVTVAGKINPASILPIGACQFLPPQMTIKAGETQSIGIQIANPGSNSIEGEVKILSELVTPNILKFKVQPGKREFLTSRINIPTSFPNALRIPAEVTINGSLTAKLELLVKTAPITQSAN